MIIKIIFWDVIPCSLIENYKCFEETFCFHLQDVELNRVLKRAIRNKDGGPGALSEPIGLKRTAYIISAIQKIYFQGQSVCGK
jgi:hypothetical protein